MDERRRNEGPVAEHTFVVRRGPPSGEWLLTAAVLR